MAVTETWQTAGLNLEPPDDRCEPKAVVCLSTFPVSMPNLGKMDEIEPTPERRVLRWTFALALALTAAAFYYLVLAVWLPGMDGCGPPGNTTAASIWWIAPFAFPCLGGLIFLIVGLASDWRGSTLVWGAFAVVVIGAIVEFVVFAEVVGGVHHCFE